MRERLAEEGVERWVVAELLDLFEPAALAAMAQAKAAKPPEVTKPGAGARPRSRNRGGNV